MVKNGAWFVLRQGLEDAEAFRRTDQQRLAEVNRWIGREGGGRRRRRRWLVIVLRAIGGEVTGPEDVVFVELIADGRGRGSAGSGGIKRWSVRQQRTQEALGGERFSSAEPYGPASFHRRSGPAGLARLGTRSWMIMPETKMTSDGGGALVYIYRERARRRERGAWFLKEE